MNKFTGEVFEAVINSGGYKLIDKGELLYYASIFKVIRGENLDLYLEASHISNDKFVDRNILDVDNLSNKLKSIELKHSYLGQTVSLKNPIVVDTLIKNNILEQTVHTKEKVRVSEIEWKSGGVILESSECFIIEWIENLQTRNMLFSELRKKEDERKIKYSFGEGFLSENPMIFIKRQEGGSRSFVFVELEDFSFYFGKTDGENNEDSGFICYNKKIEERQRRKIRKVLSFLLGSPLIYLGYSVFDEKWGLLSFKMFDVPDDYSQYKKIIAQPVTIYHDNYLGVVEKKYFSKAIDEIYQLYDTYNFDHIFFIYWNAVNSTYFSAAVHYGALIEFLQKKHSEIIKVSIGRLVEKKILIKFQN